MYSVLRRLNEKRKRQTQEMAVMSDDKDRDHLRHSAHYPVAYIEILEKRLLAYQKAFNKVDDLMEYRSMDKTQFDKIAAELTEDLK